MTRHCRLILCGLTAAFVLATAAGSASAGKLSLSNRVIRATWAALEFATEPGFSIRCPVTLEGSFHSNTIRKVIGALVGYITRASVKSDGIGCAGGNMTLLQETLPWHIRYNGFQGTLPRIEVVRINIIDFSVLILFETITGCLFRSTAASPLVGALLMNSGTGQVTGLLLDELGGIPKVRDLGPLGPCGRVASPKGTAGVTLLGTATAISIRLI